MIYIKVNSQAMLKKNVSIDFFVLLISLWLSYFGWRYYQFNLEIDENTKLEHEVFQITSFINYKAQNYQTFANGYSLSPESFDKLYIYSNYKDILSIKELDSSNEEGGVVYIRDGYDEKEILFEPIQYPVGNYLFFIDNDSFFTQNRISSMLKHLDMNVVSKDGKVIYASDEHTLIDESETTSLGEVTLFGLNYKLYFKDRSLDSTISETSGLLLLSFLLISILVYGVIYFNSMSQRNAEYLALKITDELNRKNRFIEDLLSNLPVGISVYSTSTNKNIYMNNAFSTIYGWPVDELKDVDKFYKNIYPDKKIREEIIQKITNDISSGDKNKMYWEDLPIRTMSNELKYITAKNIPLSNQGLMISTVLDTTDRKIANDQLTAKISDLNKLNIEQKNTQLAMLNILEDEKALEKKLSIERDKFNTIVSTMGDGLLVVDTNLNLTFINKMAKRLLDLNDDNKFLNKKWSDIVTTLFDNKEISVDKRTFYQVINHKKTIVTNLSDKHYYKTLKGKVFPITSITTPIVTGGKVVGAIKVFRDATLDEEAKKVIENTVKERTGQLISAISAVPRSFVVMDLNKRVLLHNGRMNEFFPSLKFEWTFESLSQIFKDNIDVEEIYLNCLKSKKAILKKNILIGSKYFEFFFAPIYADSKELIGILFMLSDVTEEVVHERSKDEFFSIASHELRTPLTAIRGNASLLIDIYKDKIKDKDFVEMTQDIHGASIRLIDIVNDFLDLSRLEQGRIEFKKEKFDLVKLISQVIEEIGSGMLNKDIKLVFKKPKQKSIEIIADSQRVRQVLINLIGNSIKFTQKGQIAVTLNSKGKAIEVVVSDTGRGIPEANKSLLFRKFQQAGDNLYTRDTSKGTGLGLYISKLLAEGMNGSIYLIDSKIGKGTSFGFTLPIN